MDVHYKFSNVTFCDASGSIIRIGSNFRSV